MLKHLSSDVWVFDCEWAPNPAVGRVVYGTDPDMSDADVVECMYAAGRAKQEKDGKPVTDRPYLKTALCQIVSIAAVVRKVTREGVLKLDLLSLPTTEGPSDEKSIIDRFLSGIGKTKPQLVGFNSVDADLPILLQRAVAHGLHQPLFCKRPDKPWEGVDYFVRYSPDHIDLKQILGGFGNATPSLHELAVSCGIPGKIGSRGQDVVDLWLAGDVRPIVQYNECDALTTYELFLRAALLSGLLGPSSYCAETLVLDGLLQERGALPGHGHILAYLLERNRLRDALAA